MSSILDALEKLESRRTQSGGPELPRRTRRSTTPLLAGAAAVAFIAGIGIAVVWLRPGTPAPAPAPAAVAQLAPPPTIAPARVATTPPRAVPAPAPKAATAPPARPAEQPWAEVVVPATVREAPAAPAPAAPTPVAARVPSAELAPPAGAPAPIVASAPPAAAAAPPHPKPAPAAPRPAGAPGVRVSFLVYSSAPDRRTVALAIDEAGLVTLHEGESSNGLSVAQILPDGVELTWQGQSFKVPARD